MKHAWDNYVKYAWGQNELKPVSRRGHSASIFGNTAFGASIVDGLDTLYIMELKDEYKKGRDWIATSLNFEGVSHVTFIVRKTNTLCQIGCGIVLTNTITIKLEVFVSNLL